VPSGRCGQMFTARKKTLGLPGLGVTRQAIGEVGLEVFHVFETDMQAQQMTFTVPWDSRTVLHQLGR